MIATIRLKQTQVKSLSFHLSDEELLKSKMEMSFSVGFDEAEEDAFLVTFNITAAAEEGYSLELAYMAVFETSEPIDEDFRKSHFPIVNAPAIAYPFLRAFISNLTLNAGFQPLIIPAVNFQALNRERDNSSDSRETEDADQETL